MLKENLILFENNSVDWNLAVCEKLIGNYAIQFYPPSSDETGGYPYIVRPDFCKSVIERFNHNDHTGNLNTEPNMRLTRKVIQLLYADVTTSTSRIPDGWVPQTPILSSNWAHACVFDEAGKPTIELGRRFLDDSRRLQVLLNKLGIENVDVGILIEIASAQGYAHEFAHYLRSQQIRGRSYSKGLPKVDHLAIDLYREWFSLYPFFPVGLVEEERFAMGMEYLGLSYAIKEYYPPDVCAGIMEFMKKTDDMVLKKFIDFEKDLLKYSGNPLSLFWALRELKHLFSQGQDTANIQVPNITPVTLAYYAPFSKQKVIEICALNNTG